MPPRVLLLSRPGCGLCREMEADLDEAFGSEAYTLERADVDSRPEWRERWGLLIPVLLDASGQVLSVTRLDVEAVSKVLGRPLRGRQPV